MSAWYWRVIALKSAFLITCLFCYLRAEETVQKLPFCNTNNFQNSANNDLLIVSTLDGRLTAFSTTNGEKAWFVETQPLLSSNLHHVELTSGGKWVRLVPSLRGTLYSLSGDTIEPLPFDAEQLLSSSFKYSDDLVVAGARETLWLGVDTSTGNVIYECGSSGCNNEEQTASSGRHVLVLRRHSNTVRALDPRTGSEKWNFSVAEHQLAVSSGNDCISTQGPVPAAPVAVALPEGVVAVKKPGSHLPAWQQKLDAPVAGIWRLHGGTLQYIDVLWEATQSLTATVQTAPPSLYIGVHNRQLYIQESQLYIQKIETSVSGSTGRWRVRESPPLLDTSALAQVPEPSANTLSLITLYGNTGRTGDHGFFLYLQETCNQAVQVTEDTFHDEPDVIFPSDDNDRAEHHHIHVHVYSLWFWWKEVLLIAISSAVLMNLMIWPRLFAPKLRPMTPLPINQEYIVVERHYERPAVNTVSEYSGRYENDFTPLRCLGRGGFGVVFEAKNNIDHCSYAVKRITLPRRESKRERVLREVRALAKLEHEHIVRYFNAWLEEPPPNWQESRDAIWMRELEGVSNLTDDYAASSLPRKSKLKDSVLLDVQKPLDFCVDALDYEKQLSEPSRRHRSLSCHDSFSIVFDENATDPSSKLSQDKTTSTPNSLSKQLTTNDDSFIVFANSEQGAPESSEARNNSFNKRLERVKECDEYTRAVSSGNQKKKKGHTRHWSLDMCVRNSTGNTNNSGTKMYLYIQMQLCLRDSLHDWLRQNRTSEARADKVKILFSQIVSAVEYVHLAGLIHRDLKPSNIFFAPDGKVKVGDFGLVTTMSDNSQDGNAPRVVNVEDKHTYRVGTHLYMSPEQMSGRPYSYKVDIYSLGVILFELLQPFHTESERVASLLKLRDQNYPSHFQELYPNETEVLKMMLSEEPSRRPTAAGVRARAPLYHQTDDRWHFTLPNICVT